jgi:hypothetical protein
MLKSMAKGDIEFEMQLQMALSATATVTKTTFHDCGSPAESSGNVTKLWGKSAIWLQSDLCIELRCIAVVKR